MKQAGVITFYDHPNYGAMLQAYGLKCALEELGCAVTFIRNAGKRNGEAPETDRRQMVLEVLRHRRDVLQPPSKVFTDFVLRHFRTEELGNRQDADRRYDLFIAGSDQVWNMEITGPDPFWFLDFAPPEKRFSYAASFGVDCLPENRLSWYSEMLAGFAGLSVRETPGVKIVRELTGREAVLCPDPVLLPERRVWENLMNPAEKAVVLYMTEFDADLCEYAGKDAEERGLPLVVTGNYRFPTADETVICAPETWLGYIACASALYTNSFHALVFSRIFHKELHIRPLVRMKNRNSRIFSFMESMGEEPAEEENRQGLFRLKGSGDREYWEEADARLDELRNTGLTYLRNIIDSRPEDMRRK